MDSLREYLLEEAELMPLVRERLAAGQTVRYLPFRGVSMLPLLRQGTDAVEISPLPAQLNKYDLPVYQYPNGKYVMHRVVKVCPDYYVCLGDNTYEPERIYHSQMLGVVSAIKRADKRISVEAPGYKLYCRVWCGLFPVRKLLKRGKNWLRRRLRK